MKIEEVILNQFYIFKDIQKKNFLASIFFACPEISLSGTWTLTKISKKPKFEAKKTILLTLKIQLNGNIAITKREFHRNI